MTSFPVGLVVALGLGLAGPADPATVVTGKVLPLAEALSKVGEKVDPDSPGVALLGDDGKVYPLIKDETSRLLFLDKQLHGRQVRLTARPAAGFLRVERVQTVKGGKAYDVDYWCDQCQLAATEPGPCKCCGGPTALRELPSK